MSDGEADKSEIRRKQIEQFLNTHHYIMNTDIRRICSVSPATANRILAQLVSEGKLTKYREGGHWASKLEN